MLAVCLLAGCGIPPQPDESAPAPASTTGAAPTPSPSPGSARPAATAIASPSTVPPNAAPSAPATTPVVPLPRPAMPSELVIPAIHVDAPVEHVGTTRDGAMDAPHAWNDVAWFDRGYRPGEHGSAVIAGHLDSTTDRAVFWDLRLLKPGDKVLLKDDDGSQLTFQVSGSEIYPYNQAPLQKIFGPSDTPMLNLVTCNGVFDRGSRNYNKRLVVYAREISA